jgi:hypothetical protein
LCLAAGGAHGSLAAQESEVRCGGFCAGNSTHWGSSTAPANSHSSGAALAAHRRLCRHLAGTVAAHAVFLLCSSSSRPEKYSSSHRAEKVSNDCRGTLFCPSWVCLFAPFRCAAIAIGFLPVLGKPQDLIPGVSPSSTPLLSKDLRPSLLIESPRSGTMGRVASHKFSDGELDPPSPL